MTPEHTDQRTLAGHLPVRRLVRLQVPPLEAYPSYTCPLRLYDSVLEDLELQGPKRGHGPRIRFCLYVLAHLVDKSLGQVKSIRLSNAQLSL